MAERSQVPPPQYGHGPASSSASALRRTRVGTGVRRNLFQNQLARRPTASSTSSGETASTTRGIDFDSAADMNIVVRDKNGDIEVFDPLALLEDDNGAIDEREEAKRNRERLAENVRQLSVARGRGEDDG